MATKKLTKKVKEMIRFQRWYERALKTDLDVRYGNYVTMQRAWLASARAKR